MSTRPAPAHARTRRLVDLCLGALALTGLVVGCWALLAPAHFFDEFPLGQGWVATDGPYNEHLVRDVGGLNLALGIATSIALARRSRSAELAVTWGWLVNGVAHFVYHLNHLGPFDTPTAAAVALSTFTTPLLAAIALTALGRAEPDRSVARIPGAPDLDKPETA